MMKSGFISALKLFIFGGVNLNLSYLCPAVNVVDASDVLT